jgi:hypothetical protein
MTELCFLVSAPRSGSTFLARALGQHPEFAMTIEAGWVALLRKSEMLAGTPSMHPIDDGEGFSTVGVVPGPYVDRAARAFRRAAGCFVESFAASVGAEGRYYGDKVHSHNDVAFLLRTFPDVRFVVLVRDLRDVLVSSYTFQQKQATAWQEASFVQRCEHLARFDAEVCGLLDERGCPVVRYEDLIEQPGVELTHVLEAIGLAMAPEVDAWLEGDAGALFQSHGTSVTPRDSVGRWRSMLDAEQQAIANDLLGDALARHGYR